MEKKNVIGNGTKTENGNENGSGIGMGTANDLEVSAPDEGKYACC